MSAYRYGYQEAQNIAKAADKVRQEGALNASVAARKVMAEVEAGYQPLDADLTGIAALTPSNDDFLQRKAGAWANRTVAQVKTDLGIDAKIEWVAAPATAASAGTAGQIAYSAGYIYVCVGASTWVRAALATW